MDFIVIGNMAHIAGFSGDFDELVNYFPMDLINSLEVLGIEKVVWGPEGEQWELLENFPKLEN